MSQRMTRRNVGRFAVLIAVVATVLSVGACGGDSGTGQGDTTGRNRADLTFVQGMIPHHQQAVEMATLALATNAQASPKVKEIAGRIKAAQDPEIELMRGWLKKWGDQEAAGGHQMSGMMSTQDLSTLAQATGANFDKMWFTMMIDHHEGAVEMAEAVKADGSDPDVKALADQIITAQQAEIIEMKNLLGQ